jgi:hypothetical protein
MQSLNRSIARWMHRGMTSSTLNHQGWPTKSKRGFFYRGAKTSRCRRKGQCTATRRVRPIANSSPSHSPRRKLTTATFPPSHSIFNTLACPPFSVAQTFSVWCPWITHCLDNRSDRRGDGFSGVCGSKTTSPSMACLGFPSRLRSSSRNLRR